MVQKTLQKMAQNSIFWSKNGYFWPFSYSSYSKIVIFTPSRIFWKIGAEKVANNGQKMQKTSTFGQCDAAKMDFMSIGCFVMSSCM